MKVLIASPTYDGNVRKEYMQSVMQLTNNLNHRGIKWDLLIEPATILHTMRSVMASHTLLNSEYSHLLFIDTDLSFTSKAVERLLDASVDVIGCAYPYRTIPLHLSPPEPPKPLRQTISSLVPYALKHAAGTTSVDVTDGICEVEGIGTGLLLIRRNALERLAECKSIRQYQIGFPYSQWHLSSHYYGFFDHIEVNGAHLGEDYSFSYRWINEGNGKIHALVDEEISHIGPLPVLGRYTDRLRSGQI